MNQDQEASYSVLTKKTLITNPIINYPLWKTKRTIGKIAMVLFVFLISIQLVGFTNTPAPQVIRVGVYENAPKFFTDDHGSVTGFWGDLIKTIAQHENWEIEWVHCSWDECLQKLSNNEIDMMPDVAWSQARSELFDFSNETVLVSWSQVYVPKDSEIETIFDLEGKKIGGLAGSVNLNGPEGIKDLESKFNISSTFFEMDSYTAVFEALESKSVDAGVVNNFFGDLNEQKYEIARTSIIFQPSNIQFAFTKDGEMTSYLIAAIDEEIKAMKEDSRSGYYAALDRHLGAKISSSLIEVIPTWVITLIVACLGLIVFLFIVSITSRMIANNQTAQLRSSESRIRALIESIPDLIFRYDENGKFLDFHAKSDDKLFVKPEEFLGKTIRDVLPEKIAQTAIEKIQKTISSNEIQVYEYQLLVGGEIRDFESRYSACGDKEVLAIIRDVTERRQAETRIQLLNRLYATISQINQTIVYAEDKGQLFRKICEVAIEFGKFRMAWIGMIDHEDQLVKSVFFAGEEQGYLKDLQINYRDEILGSGPTGTAIREGRCVVSRDIANDPKMKPWCQKALSHGYKASASVPIRQNNLVVGAFSVYASEPLAFDNEEERLLEEIGQDISFALDNLQAEHEHNLLVEELTKSEQRYQTLANISPVGIFKTDTQGKTTYVNPTWTTISGLSAEEAMGFGWLKVVHPDDVDRIQENWKKATEHLSKNTADYRFIHADGSVVWVIGQAVPELNSDNQIIGYVGTITDITERKQIEDLRMAVEKAESADKLKSAFLATMSHELRTPLNSIIGFTGILLQKLVGPLGEEQEKQLKMVQGSARHLLDLINDVLDISKIEAGEIEIRNEKLEFEKVILKSVEKILPLAEKKGLKVTTGISSSIGEIISDQRRLEQVMLNLLSNAVKFTDQGEINIKSKVIDGQIMTSVRDSGIGIKPENVETLFIPFKQIDSGLTRQYEGTGLGLSICKRIVELLGGRIWVESEFGKGSTFIFTLPIIKDKNDEKSAGN